MTQEDAGEYGDFSAATESAAAALPISLRLWNTWCPLKTFKSPRTGGKGLHLRVWLNSIRALKLFALA
jgi:hypothetical protein